MGMAVAATLMAATAGGALWAGFGAAMDAEGGRLARLARVEARWAETVTAQRGADDGWVVLADRLVDLVDFTGGLRVGIGQREGESVGYLILRGAEGLEPTLQLPRGDGRAALMGAALEGRSGWAIGLDHRGVEVLAAHEPIGGGDLGLVLARDLAEVRGPLLGRLAWVGGAVAGLLAAALGLAWAAYRGAARQEALAGRWQGLMAGSRDAVMVLDDAGRIEACNPAAEAYFGYGAAELFGRSAGLLLPEPEHGRDPGGLAVFATAGRREIVLLARDGRSLPVELTVDGLGTRTERHWLCVVGDLGERQAHARWQHDLVALLGRELRGPLVSIQGALALLHGLGQGAAPLDREKIVSLIDIARRNGERLTHLIDDLLDMERLRAGAVDMAYHAEDLTTLVREAVGAGRAAAERFSVGLALHEPLAEARVAMDRPRLSQAIAQVLSNAAKFSPPGAAVDIELTAEGSRWAKLVVADRGSGIPAELRPRLFAGFQQGPTVAGRPREGSGVGLAIARAIVERHAGRIDFADRDGGGTIFAITLPLYKEPEVP